MKVCFYFILGILAAKAGPGVFWPGAMILLIWDLSEEKR